MCPALSGLSNLRTIGAGLRHLGLVWYHLRRTFQDGPSFRGTLVTLRCYYIERRIRIAYGMDLTTTIAELRREKEKLARVLASLEELQNASTIAAPRRGRKSMNAEERQEVSARMKR